MLTATQVFGCSHDNGFARLLEKYVFDATISTRITLLEGIPFGKELLGLPFNRSKFGTIFRSEKIAPPPIGAPPANRNGLETAAAAALLRSMNHTPSESVSSNGEAGYAKPGAIATWAGRAAVAANLPPPTPPAEKVTPAAGGATSVMGNLTKDTIPRNRKGQRLDPPVKHDKAEVERVRRMKMCNIHFLRGECPYGPKCTHKHDKTPSPRDLEILRVVARYSCCRQGGGCDDPKYVPCSFPSHPFLPFFTYTFVVFKARPRDE